MLYSGRLQMIAAELPRHLGDDLGDAAPRDILVDCSHLWIPFEIHFWFLLVPFSALTLRLTVVLHT